MRFRTCVVGVGRVGAEHARILSQLPDSHLIGVHDIDPVRGEEIAQKLGVRHAPEPGSLLAEADAAVVAVPTATHGPVAQMALEAGCHVLVEKPLAPTLEEADRLIGIAEERKLQLGVGHVERFNSVLRLCRRYLDGPLFIESLRMSPFPGRGTDVSVVLDLMIHDIDLVLGLVGSPVASIHAVGVPVISGSVDIANARLLFDNGAVANVTASRVSADRKRQLRLFQPSGYMRLDLISGQGEYLRRREGAPASSADSESSNGVPRGLSSLVERVPLAGTEEEPLKAELESFLQAIQGVESELVSAREGRAALEVALRITQRIEESTHVVAQDS